MYVMVTPRMVNSSVRSKQLLCLGKIMTKTANKDVRKIWNFVRVHNHFPLLTRVCLTGENKTGRFRTKYMKLTP